MTEAKKVPDLTPPVGGVKKTVAKGGVAEAKPAKEPKAPKEPKPPKAVKEPKESSGAGSPRPRKYEYGIKPDAQVVVVAEQAEAAKRAGVAKAYEIAKTGTAEGKTLTVEQFYAGGGNRHDLRVMSRRGLIKIRWATGEEFPQNVVPKPLEPPKPEDAKTDGPVGPPAEGIPTDEV